MPVIAISAVCQPVNMIQLSQRLLLIPRLYFLFFSLAAAKIL